MQDSDVSTWETIDLPWKNTGFHLPCTDYIYKGNSFETCTMHSLCMTDKGSPDSTRYNSGPANCTKPQQMEPNLHFEKEEIASYSLNESSSASAFGDQDSLSFIHSLDYDSSTTSLKSLGFQFNLEMTGLLNTTISFASDTTVEAVETFSCTEHQPHESMPSDSSGNSHDQQRNATGLVDPVENADMKGTTSTCLEHWNFGTVPSIIITAPTPLSTRKKCISYTSDQC